MNLRQTRRHFYGNSNADFKSAQAKGEAHRIEGMNTMEFLALPKKKTFEQLVELREKHKPPPDMMEKT